ncbi:hypothetical protein GCM10027026_35030 [Myroides odoratimimus subsp. xuanwuensis]
MTVGDYSLLTRIGEGGMGVVHLARKTGGERVALKVLRPHVVGDDEARQRLAREVGSLSRVRSRRVAEIVDADPWGDIPFVATRYVPGLSLHDHVQSEGALHGDDLIWFAGCLAEALEAVHAVDVLHRDVKPSNVLMEGRSPVLIDFGLARLADDPKLTHTGWLLGTPGYLAPEILYGEEATAASDIHSWAATVVYAALGHSPFGRGPAMAIMDRARRGEHDLRGFPGDAGRELRQLVESALDPDPRRRPTLDTLLDRLGPRLDRLAPGMVAGVAAAAEQDQFTMPFAAVQGEPAAQTDVLEEPATEQAWGPEPAWAGDPWAEEPATRRATAVLPPEHQPYQTPPPVDGDAASPWADDAPWQEPPVTVPVLERMRRWVLVGAGGIAAGAAVAAMPYVAVTLLVLAAWLLRSGSLAASAAGERRAQRGRRWYDGIVTSLAAPWHLVGAIPGTLLLVLWALGLAAAAVLLGYAAALGMATTLAIAGAAFALGLWVGPGGDRVRGPLNRIVHPVCAGLPAWLVATALAVGLAMLLLAAVESAGVDWAPSRQAPLDALR